MKGKARLRNAKAIALTARVGSPAAAIRQRSNPRSRDRGHHRVHGVAGAFDQERPRLLPHAAHPFPMERIETVRSAKTIYVRFDLNQYSIPPNAVGRQLTLAASDTAVRVLDGPVEIARHCRSYDRGQTVLDPAHQDAVLATKRKARDATPAGRLEQLVPESQTLLDQSFAQGESPAREAARLTKLLDEYGATALRRAINEALERSTPRADSVAFLLRRQPRSHSPETGFSKRCLLLFPGFFRVSNQ